MSFNTYYWHAYPLDDVDLARARDDLATRHAVSTRPAFEALLRSDNPAAVSIALDHYQYADMQTRHGRESPFSPYSREVGEKARRILEQPPMPAMGDYEEGANHASALGALLNLAKASDADLIDRALRLAHTASVRYAAANAAGAALAKAKKPHDVLVAALANLLNDESASSEERHAALQAIARSSAPAATEALLKATRMSDLGLQASAAMRLIDRDLPTHRAYLETVVRGWPPDAPYPADQVRDSLAETSRP